MRMRETTVRQFRKGAAAVAAAAALVLSACAKQAVSTTPAGSGATAVTSVGSATSKGAVDGFLAAVKQQNLQAMSTLWGNKDGLARDRFKRDDLEKRLIVMQCLLNHDRYSYDEPQARMSTGNRNLWRVSLQKRNAKASTTFTTVPGPGGRWLLEDVDVAPLREFCS